MTVSKRDTIIIAVLVNVGLLAILLITAINNNEDEIVQDSIVISQPIASAENTIPIQEMGQEAAISPVDEVDHALTQYSNTQVVTTQSNDNEVQSDNHEITNDVISSSPKEFVEVTVKKGDSLDKIARANKTTIEEIRKASNLSTDKLNIGQVLKVPVNKISTSKKPATTPQREVAVAEGTYYTIKTGDSPWKVAKQFNVNYEDILKLNNMSAEKARNLKPGDQIRVK
jgi:LysM repeat protein